MTFVRTTAIPLLACLIFSRSAAIGDDGARLDEKRTPQGAAKTNLPEYLGPTPRWVSGSKCGPNSLFVLLSLMRLDADIDRVTELARISPETGCSIGDLQRTAGEFGLATEVRFVSPSQMTQLPFPFIAHVSPGDERSPLGHFLVVFDYRLKSQDFGIIDGTSGNHSYRNAIILSRSLSGYALIPQRKRHEAWLRESLFIGSMIVAGLLVWQSISRYQRAAAVVTSRKVPDS